jgi:hypothetical protein
MYQMRSAAATEFAASGNARRGTGDGAGITSRTTRADPGAGGWFIAPPECPEMAGGRQPPGNPQITGGHHDQMLIFVRPYRRRDNADV